jgi:hypothetical protein
MVLLYDVGDMSLKRVKEEIEENQPDLVTSNN